MGGEDPYSILIRQSYWNSLINNTILNFLDEHNFFYSVNKYFSGMYIISLEIYQSKLNKFDQQMIGLSNKEPKSFPLSMW